MTSLMTLKPGTSGYLKLGPKFAEPRWREAMVVGVQVPWIQTLVRGSKDEIEQTGLSFVQSRESFYILVEAEFTQLVGGCPEVCMMLDGDMNDIMMKGVAAVQSDEELNYATATEPRDVKLSLGTKKKSKPARSSESDESSEDDGDNMLEQLRCQWLGAGMSEGKQKRSKEGSRERSRQRFALLDKPRKDAAGSKDVGAEFQGRALQAAVQSEDPLKGLLALHLMQMNKEKGRKKDRTHRRRSSSRSSSRTSSSSSDQDAEKLLKRHSKAIQNYQLSGRRMFADPLKHIKKYVKDLEKELGAEGRPYKITDQNRRIAFGRQRNLQRCHFLMGQVLEILLKNKPDKAALQATLSLQAMRQAALDQGEWTVAWLITHSPDPFGNWRVAACDHIPEVDERAPEIHGTPASKRRRQRKSGGCCRPQQQGREGKGRKTKGKEKNAEKNKDTADP